MFEGKNIMQERESSRNRGMQEDWNWQEQERKMEKEWMEGRRREMAKVMGERNSMGETWEGGEAQIQEVSEKEW